LDSNVRLSEHAA